MVKTYFSWFDLPEGYSLDLDKLEQQYLTKSRELHPDFHRESATVQHEVSQDLSAQVNQAYNTLKDSFRRADYLIQLRGGPTPSQVRDVPPEFLEQVLDWRLEIASLKKNPTAAQRFEEELLEKKETLLAEVGKIIDSGGSLEEARRKLNLVKYLNNLIQDLLAD